MKWTALLTKRAKGLAHSTTCRFRRRGDIPLVSSERIIHSPDAYPTDVSSNFVIALRALPNGLTLAEALLAPELSVVAEGEGRARARLARRLRTWLEREAEESPLRLHRRHAEVAEPITRRLEVTLHPTRREPAWEEPVTLAFDAVFWREGEEPARFHGRVPGVEALHVMANDLAAVERRVLEHLRLLLLREEVSLRSLAAWLPASSLALGLLEVELKTLTPRKIAEKEEGQEEAASPLAQVATDLTKAIREAPPREMEEALRLLAETLGSAEPASALLIGPPGVGKTTLARSFAQRRKEFGFANTPIWSTDGARLIAGQTGFGMWQERCRDIIREAARTKAIVHLGHLWELMEVGKFVGNTQSIAAFLRPAIARGELLVIAESTPEQFAVIERSEPHLAQAFQTITLAEPPPEATLRLLRHVSGQTTDDDTALRWLHRLHERYATYSARPGRPIGFLRRLMLDRPGALPSEGEVTAAFARETGLPEALLDDNRTLDLDETRRWFAARVLGQPEAVEAVLGALAAIKARLTRPGLPLASLLFIGPTGTGKTELAKALAQFLFGSAERLARFDLNEFADSLAIQRLIGGPAVGAAEGLLTARVREHPFSVLLFDEFEKADPSFFDLLLQILGDGRLTDASGRVADFRNTAIIMTSNLGAREFVRGALGFAAEGASGGRETAHFTQAVRDFLRPEIHNRIGAIVPFRPITRSLAKKVLRRRLDLLRERDGWLADNVRVEWDAEVEEWLLARGFDERLGARPLKRALERELMTPLAEKLNAMPAASRKGCLLRVSLADSGLRVESKTRRKGTKEGETESGRFALARAAADFRRETDRMTSSQAYSEMENELPFLEQSERRNAAKDVGAAQATLSSRRLRQIRSAFAEVSALQEEAREFEANLLVALHQGGNPDSAEGHEKLRQLREKAERLRRSLFMLAWPDHGHIALMLVADQRDWLHLFARVYVKVAESQGGGLKALEYLVPPKEGDACVRVPAKTLVPLFHEAPGNHIGLLLLFHGDLMKTSLLEERGQHEKQMAQGRWTCCVHPFEAAEWTRFVPPADAHRAAFLKSRELPIRRVVDLEAGTMFDARAAADHRFGRGKLEDAIQLQIRTALEETILDHTS